MRVDTKVRVINANRRLCGGCVIPFWTRTIHGGLFWTEKTKFSLVADAPIVPYHPSLIDTLSPAGHVTRCWVEGPGLWAEFQVDESWQKLLPDIERSRFYFCCLNAGARAVGECVEEYIIKAISLVEHPGFLPSSEKNWLTYYSRLRPEGFEISVVEDDYGYSRNPVIAAMPLPDEFAFDYIFGPKAFNITSDGRIEVNSDGCIS